MTEGGAAVSVGIDLVDVARIADLRKRYGRAFLERTFCGFEISYCEKFSNPDIHYAARFAAKEAVAKALQTGFADGVSLAGIGVKISEGGAPSVWLDAPAQERLEALGASKILISLAHLKDYAQAIALAVK